MSIPVALRGDFDAAGLRRLARGSKDANQARRLLALATVYAGGTRSEAAAVGGVGRSCGTGSYGSTPMGQQACSTAKRPANPPGSTPRIAAPLARCSKPGRSPPSMASCAGGWSIWCSGSGRSSRSRSRRRPWAASCARWAIASSRPAPAIMRRTPMPRSLLKSVPCPSGGDRSRRGRGQAHRGLVRR